MFSRGKEVCQTRKQGQSSEEEDSRQGKPNKGDSIDRLTNRKEKAEEEYIINFCCVTNHCQT